MVEIKPHAVMVEFLFQGHITPFLHLAVALASKGCAVTYIQTEYIKHLISKSNPIHSLFAGAVESCLDIRCTTISDGFPLHFDRTLNFHQFYQSILTDFPARIDDLVGKIVASDRSSGGRLRPFLVADSSYLWPAAVAARHGIVNVSFWTSTALQLSIGHHLELLKENGLISSYGDYKDELHDSLGINSSCVRDHIGYTLVEDDIICQILKDSMMKVFLDVKKADFVLCNTVQELEDEALSVLNHKFPTYAIGPTNFCGKISVAESLRSGTDCTEWLSKKPPHSVLYVSFGSIAPTEKEVVREMAHGLSDSGVNFLWVLRPDQNNSEDPHEKEAVLPPELPGDRGLFVPWCNQREVLSNPAIAGFLTHCGWNSLLESMWFRVPLLCYPIFSDQPVNRNRVVQDWKIGINLCDQPQVSRQEVAGKINKFMSGLEGLRLRMDKVSKIMQDALATNGSSDKNLDKFLQDLKNKICT